MSDRRLRDPAETSALSTRPDVRLVATDLDGTLDDAREVHHELWSGRDGID